MLSNSTSIIGSKRQAPLSDGFVRNHYTTFREEIFDIAKARRKTMIKPHRPCDDRGRKPVSAIIGSPCHESLSVIRR